MITRVDEHRGQWTYTPVELGGEATPVTPKPSVAKASAWDELQKLTFAIQHNPNCRFPWMVRLPGKGPIDMLPYGGFLVRHRTGDVLGFGKTLEEAARAALNNRNELAT
jgi:hypothetical protein